MRGPAASPAGSHDAPITYRPARPGDRAAMVALAGSALGWRPADPNAELFSWKHDASPFGASPAWLAECDGELVGLRVLLRWTFDGPEGPGSSMSAVRAVDTATHPRFQGRGIFRALTMAAVDELREAGTGIVFNTPNDQSRPGYLKMGWEVLGRVPIGVSVRTPIGIARTATARTPAGKWSLPTDVGDDARTVLGATAARADRDALVRAIPPSPVGMLSTRRDPAFFAWRYAAGPLEYRVLRRGRNLDDGFLVFRLRSRGAATEATVCDVVHPDRDPRIRGELVRALLRETGADYAISVLPGRVGPGPTVAVPGQGPVFTWRPLALDRVPPLQRWDLRLGDIELF